MSITSPDDRISFYNPVVATTEFSAQFPVFDNDDIKVFVDGVERDDFAVTATYTEGVSNDAKAVFAAGITGSVAVVGDRDPHRTNRFSNGGPLPVRDQNLALDTIQSEVQELHRESKRALKVAYGADEQIVPAPESGKVLGWSPLGKLVNLLLAGTAAVAFGAAGLVLAATSSFAEVRSVLDAKYVLSADKTGAVDASFALATASVGNTLIRLPPGLYRIAQNLTIQSACTLEFDNGAMLVRDPGVKVTLDCGIIAGPLQHIFGGVLVDSAYTRIGDTPYDFGYIGAPRIEWSSPCWFGGVGDFVADDELALHCAQYFGRVMFIPPIVGGGFKTSKFIMHRRDGQRMFGYGYQSRVGSTGASLGAVLGFRGDPPVTAGGGPARFVVGCSIEGIHVDGADATNNNAMGGSHCRNCKIVNCFFSNVGRKAITWQYHVKDCIDYGNTIYDAATEVGSTHAAISIEGQTAGINYTAEGGYNGVDDLFGTDVVGIHSGPNTIESSGYNYVVVQRATGCVVRVTRAGDCLGAGRHVVCGAYAKKNKVTIDVAGNTERSFVAMITDSEDNEVAVNGGDATGTGTDGYSVLDQGKQNKISGACDHSNTSTTNSRAIELQGAGSKLEFFVRSCDSSTVIGGTGADVQILPGTKIEASGRRSVFAAGTGWKIAGDFNPGGATGVQLNAANCACRGATIRGDGPNRGLVSSGVAGAVFVDNMLPGVNPTIDWTTLADLWASGVKLNNPGDVSTYHCARMGGRIDGAFGGTPEAVITAAVGSTIRDTAGGNVYRKGSGSGNTGWVAM
ncbi:hypothetical protein IB276_11605 [Ensifer sp. ENS04]|uniref:hypothetical protein n=1 Tax=Ensifer sp. ENS04 TaxID=2769281 RepID=UPI00177AE3B7|nr:hypothetical protein [Ensifer sp. ENS04]MBD9540099.1 hypothetical protein [Ensifer sp. ENS04]